MSITIPDSHLGYLKDAYDKIYKDYLVKRDALDKEWAELKPMLDKLGIGVNGTKHKPVQTVLPIEADNEEYNPKLSWLRKAKVILRTVGKPLTSNEIIDVMLTQFEPKMERQAAVNSIPATLSVAAKEGKINRRPRGNEYEYYL